MTVRNGPAVTDQDLDQLSALFRLLSDRTRLSILLKLAAGERNVTTLCEELGLPQPTVSHHLALLRMSNMVKNRRSGKQVFYTLNSAPNTENDGALAFAVPNFLVRIGQ